MVHDARCTMHDSSYPVSCILHPVSPLPLALPSLMSGAEPPISLRSNFIVRCFFTPRARATFFAASSSIYAFGCSQN